LLANHITTAFPLTDTAEFSVEIDPSEVDDARLDALVAAGLNRASLGVQDFDPVIQRAIGRIQPFDLTAEVVSGLRRRGVGDINIDMLYGLPHQTLKGIARSVEQVLSLEPQRVALYGYAHVPWVSRRQQMIPEATLPPPENRLDLYLQASDQFALAGYIPIGIDHFAKADDNLARAAQAGRLRRNFQGYTDDDSPTLIGLGASAISRLPQGYAQNASATAAYTQAIRGAQLSTHRGYALQPEDHLRARLIEMVMCYGVIDTAVLAIEFPGSDQIVASICDRIIARFGMVLRHDGPRLVLTEEGRPLTRLVARMCDGFAASATRGSSAI
jgi:oxygen-independent coproporphyrinogen III oxidase